LTARLGYPEPRVDRDPYPSRIILVADTVEAMTSDRPYRRALPSNAWSTRSGLPRHQFDPDAADAFHPHRRARGSPSSDASKFDIENFVAEPGDVP
jgi:HD-GYP domain-containing protein (c-di-GMP phosphodiesterase class II)